MKQLLPALISLIITLNCLGQTKSPMLGTWVLYKISIDNHEASFKDDSIARDTIIISDERFEQRTWTKDHDPYRQSGVMTFEKDKLILTKRSTSTSDQHGPPQDIYYTFKLKKKVLILSNAAVLSEKPTDNVKAYYRKLTN